MNPSEDSVSICIATHERPQWLGPTLEAIARQTVKPLETVVSDSSSDDRSRRLVEQFASDHPDIAVRYLESCRSALPWHRWWASKHARGAFVLFLDDDIRLSPNAVEVLQATRRDLEASGCEQVAGIGLTLRIEGGQRSRRRASFHERWLRTGSLPSFSITQGGWSTGREVEVSGQVLQVERFSGGSMAFRRDVLESVGPLEHLYRLYDLGVGRSEDAVLSQAARRQGPLFQVTSPLAVHPSPGVASHTVWPHVGWNAGLGHTWGRACVMRWMASDINAWRRDWHRVASLEVMRAVKSGPLRHPFRSEGWARLAGACFGTLLGLLRWRTIPASARCSFIPSSGGSVNANSSAMAAGPRPGLIGFRLCDRCPGSHQSDHDS